MNQDTIQTTILITILACVVATLLIELRASKSGDGLTPKARRRRAIAQHAMAYAEQMGGESHEKLRHALHHAHIMAPDFTDSEMRLEIESVLGSVEKTADN